MVEYKIDDKGLNANAFICFVKRVWPGNYDYEKTQDALVKTMNITAYENGELVGCLRLLSDGIILGRLQSCLFYQNFKRRG
nr:hypothetical protein [Lachnoclostridium sp. An14]